MTPGLTSAVASPAKNGLDYYEYKGNDASQETKGTFQTIHWYKLLIWFNWSLAWFLSMLTAIQAKLAHLELENGILRQRIWELECELESCQAEVAHEWTRVLERESIIAQQSCKGSVHSGWPGTWDGEYKRQRKKRSWTQWSKSFAMFKYKIIESHWIFAKHVFLYLWVDRWREYKPPLVNGLHILFCIR